MSNTKKSVATTKSAKSNTGVKPSVMVSEVKDIKEQFGKCAILIKGNMVYRCSTNTLEKGPKCLNELYLPNYGKMRKFIVLNDGVYEITTIETYDEQTFAQYKYTKQDKVNIDASKIDFSTENAWNYKKVTE